MFTGRSLLIATKHRKETVIAPLFEREFGLHCFTSDVFDTDSLGTFTGEIARKKNVLETLRDKCRMAAEATTADLVVASEGSFGAHPTIFMAHADDEWVMLKDYANDIEIVAREISTDTNFFGEQLSGKADLEAFAERVQFPTHGIILKPSETNHQGIIKGITSHSDLIKGFEKLHSEYGSVYAETDMRALYNPTRMKVIEKATEKLIAKIKNGCPQCNKPGFDIGEVKPGLPCEMCGSPTRSTLSVVYQCKSCQHQEEEKYPRGIRFEDPMYCDYCNP